MKTRRSSQGFVLIEVLVALLIFALGMLGLLGFQANAAKLTTESQFRTDAASIVDELFGEMRVADPTKIATEYSSGGTALGNWEKNRLVELGSNAKLDSIKVVAGPSNSFQVDVQVSWTVPGSKSGSMSYATSALIF